MSRLTRDRTAEPVSRDQILRRERGQGNMIFSCSAEYVQDWQPYPVDPYSCYMCNHTYIHGCNQNYTYKQHEYLYIYPRYKNVRGRKITVPCFFGNCLGAGDPYKDKIKEVIQS